MMRKILAYAVILWGMGGIAATAQTASEDILPLDGHIAQNGQKIELNWFDAKPPRVGSVTVKRRLYGQTGGESWQTIATGLGPVMRYTDDTITPGVAYEYQVLRNARDIVDVGYWLAGTQVPAKAQKGHAYLIVDDTIAEALAPRLARFEQDLTGDGWRVQRLEAARGNLKEPIQSLQTALEIKTWLRARHQEDPFGRHTIILVGHVPMVKGGKVSPDGHEPAPHVTDLFYADMDGRWSVLRKGEMLDIRIPGNFIEMQIGRIDFEALSEGQKETEIRLLRAYFDKNHHWRHGYLGDLREAYGKADHLKVERAALRNIVGLSQVTLGGHHDVGEEKPWLWGVDFGDRKGADYAEKYANRAVFALNFGSGKQRINGRFSPMTALLAQPWYTVAVGWGARPAWWLHHMALGGSIGEVHLRTVNNGEQQKPYRDSMDYFPTGKYLMRNAIWVNLLGDPTLRAFPLTPPRQVTLRSEPQGISLIWLPSSDPDTIGYRVFRAAPGSAGFRTLPGAQWVTNLEFTDPDPVENARYMVRAYGLKQVYAGSFHTYSQGVFTAQAHPPEMPLVQDITLDAPAGLPVALPSLFNEVTEGRIHAFIQGPTRGTLTQMAEGWVYTPPTGFTGTVDLAFSVWDSGYSTPARLILNITD